MYLFGSFTKEALETAYRQETNIVQKLRKPSATIIKNRPSVYAKEFYQDKFYNQLVDLLRTKGYSVKLDNNQTSHLPIHDNLVISHMNGGVKSRLLGKENKKIHIPERKGNLFFNHVLTKRLKQQLEEI